MTIKSLAAFFAALLIALYSTCGFAQNGFRSEADLLKQASKHFEAAEYAKALPLYSQAVSNHPENSEYNYRLGVCMVEAGKQKEEAVRFLEMAAKSDQINPDVNYYLGIALNHASRFDESVVALEKFRRSGVRKEKVKAADEYIRYGRNALEAQSDLSADRNDVIGKSETDVSGLAGMYKFETDAGRIMQVPAELADKNCKGEMTCDYFFLSKGGTTLVLARNMGKGRGYDLFRMTRQRNGKWSEPVDFGPTVNTAADEVYGTLSPDGKTLFFSSNGPTSTGGYDLFKSVMNPGGNTWSAPSSMGFPVNSPGNDFYYVISDVGTKAFFASDRESASGRFHVYEVAVTRDTRRFFAIEGKFTCPQCIDQTSASISVIDPETMGAVAHVRSRPGTDEYKLKLYVPGDFIYQVEADGFSFAQQVVNLEERGRGTVFQEIILRRDDSGSEKLVIVNRYDESQEPLTIPVQAAMEVQTKEAAAPVVNETTAVAVTPENTEIPEAKVAEVPVVAAPVVEQPVAEVQKPEATEPKAEQPVNEMQITAQEAEVQAIANELPTAPEPVRATPEPQITDKQEVVSPAAEVQPASVGVPPIFKVQLGAYYSVSEKDLRKRMAGKVPADAEYIRNDKGYIQLISGNMPDYESAKNLKEQFIAAGFEGAFVVVFAGERQAVLAEYVKPETVQP